MNKRQKQPKKAGQKSPRTLSVQECADALSMSPELLRDYAQRGCPHDKGRPGQSNRFDPAEVTAWMRANHLTGKPGRPTEKEDSPDLEAARLRKENALAAKYELQVQRERGELVPVEDVKRWIGEHVTAAKNKLIGLGAAVTPQLEGRDAAERQTVIDTRVTEILNELAGATP